MTTKDELNERLCAGLAQAAAGTTHDLGSFSHYLDDAEVCLDARNQWHPEHDYPPVGRGGHCARCGAGVVDE